MRRTLFARATILAEDIEMDDFITHLASRVALATYQTRDSWGLWGLAEMGRSLAYKQYAFHSQPRTVLVKSLLDRLKPTSTTSRGSKIGNGGHSFQPVVFIRIRPTNGAGLTWPPPMEDFFLCTTINSKAQAQCHASIGNAASAHDPRGRWDRFISTTRRGVGVHPATGLAAIPLLLQAASTPIGSR